MRKLTDQKLTSRRASLQNGIEVSFDKTSAVKVLSSTNADLLEA
jgi:hypothetical protein